VVSKQVPAGESTMTNANRQFPIEAGSNTIVMAAAAIVLILLGIVFQLGELGYGHFDPRNYWLFSVFASGIWNMLALRLAPGVHDMIQFWPLILVGTGLAVLLVSRKNGLWRGSTETFTGDRHGR
jgi:hypothetical protein